MNRCEQSSLLEWSLCIRNLLSRLYQICSDYCKPCSDLLSLHYGCCDFVFGFRIGIPLGIYMSESSDTWIYVVTTSINCINRWRVLPLRQVIGKWFHLYLENGFFFGICVNLYATCLAINSPPCCSHFILDENWCRYSFCVYLPLVSKAISPWIASFDWFQSKWVFFKLCHGHGLWIRIIIKVVCNHGWEMYVDSCRLLVIWFSRIYIIGENIVYPWWLFVVSQYGWV